MHSIQAIYIQIQSNTYRYIPCAYSGYDTDLHTIHTGTCRHMQAHTGTYRYIQVHAIYTDRYYSNTYRYSQYRQIHTAVP